MNEVNMLTKRPSLSLSAALLRMCAQFVSVTDNPKRWSYNYDMFVNYNLREDISEITHNNVQEFLLSKDENEDDDELLHRLNALDPITLKL